MESILNIVHTLSSKSFEGRRAGSQGGKRANNFIEEQLRSLKAETLPGYESYSHDLNDEKGQIYGQNILGVISGQGELKNEYLLVEAHYDHLGLDEDSGQYFPGANDNAAAVAVVLHAGEKYRMLTKALPSCRSLILAFFDAEEPPFFNSDKMGVMKFCKTPPLPLDAIKTGIFLDLLGHPSIPCKILEKGVFAAGGEKSGYSDAIDTNYDDTNCHFHRVGIHSIPPSGNYLAFKNLNKSFLFLTSGRSAHYHDISDSAEKLDYPKLTHISERLSRLLRDISTIEDDKFQYNIKSQDDKTSVSTLRKIIQCIDINSVDEELNFNEISEVLRKADSQIEASGTLNDFERSKLTYILGVLEKNIRI
ncbi:MAG: M28 family peptidase [Candidatus Marinimicrobia bacterium]|nr:M28 family peptidase [Candidatus Neomarinimicrobiota bacterium]